jgi:hypothetical protein
MNNRRKALAGLAVLTVAGLAMTGCKATADGSAPTSGGASQSAGTAMLPPQQALVAALANLATTGYDVTTTAEGGALKGTGAVDPKNKSATIEEKGTVQGVTVDIAATEINTDLWAKVDLGAQTKQLGLDPTKWMLLDLTKLTGKNSKPFDSKSGDAMDIAGLLSKVVDVQRVDATHLSGTVDLTAATGVDMPDADALTKAGAKAQKVPFTVTLDSQGRPSDIMIDASKINKELTFDIAVSNWGSPSAITKPNPADVVPAPAGAYSFFNQN